MMTNTVTHRHVLLQSALRENTVQFGAQLSLRQDGKHDALQHHGLSALKTHNRKRLTTVLHLDIGAVYTTVTISAVKTQ